MGRQLTKSLGKSFKSGSRRHVHDQRAVTNVLTRYRRDPQATNLVHPVRIHFRGPSLAFEKTPKGTSQPDRHTRSFTPTHPPTGSAAMPRGFTRSVSNSTRRWLPSSFATSIRSRRESVQKRLRPRWSRARPSGLPRSRRKQKTSDCSRQGGFGFPDDSALFYMTSEPCTLRKQAERDVLVVCKISGAQSDRSGKAAQAPGGHPPCAPCWEPGPGGGLGFGPNHNAREHGGGTRDTPWGCGQQSRGSDICKTGPEGPTAVCQAKVLHEGFQVVGPGVGIGKDDVA